MLEPNVRDLGEMLRYRRPHLSVSERKFINRFIVPLGVKRDGFGNLYKAIPEADGSAPRVLWSSHTDTVHYVGGKQDIILTEDEKFIALAKGERGCLGADNGAGVWLLRELILAGKPGLYCFFRQEESGRHGSEFFAVHSADVYKDCKAAIAFDRRGTHSVITHQFVGRTCSNAFARSLASNLKLGHVLDDGGSYTDTASFYDKIPECTNVSVGYANEHSANETLDWQYLLDLRVALLELDASALTIERDPTNIDDCDLPWWQRDDWDFSRDERGDFMGRRSYNRRYDAFVDDADDWKPRAPTFGDLIADYPDFVADILEQSGYTPDSLAECIDRMSGFTTKARRGASAT